jgi:hypothetical protein
MLHTYFPSNNNSWDSGFPAGGNYWSDYNGTDLNLDGLGDTPYLVFENDTDHYPLLAPFSSIDVQPIPTVSPSPEPASTPTSSPEPQPAAMPYPATLVTGSAVAAAAVSFGLLFYFNKGKKAKGQQKDVSSFCIHFRSRHKACALRGNGD